MEGASPEPRKAGDGKEWEAGWRDGTNVFGVMCSGRKKSIFMQDLIKKMAKKKRVGKFLFWWIPVPIRHYDYAKSPGLELC